MGGGVVEKATMPAFASKSRIKKDAPAMSLGEFMLGQQVHDIHPTRILLTIRVSLSGFDAVQGCFKATDSRLTFGLELTTDVAVRAGVCRSAIPR